MTESRDVELLTYLKTFISERRKKIIIDTLNNRTRFITVVLENVYYPQNASAILRTCECMGIQDIHIIEKRNKYQINKHIVKGANKWLDLHYYRKPDEDNTLRCIQQLKKEGYKIVTTTPHQNDMFLENFEPTEKCAIVFGSEENGVSKEMIAHSDSFLKIPIFGFTESYNLSVSVGIILNHCINYLHSHPETEWHLTPQYMLSKQMEWYIKSIKMGKDIVKKFNSEKMK
jgi:tRNA (guanosine-2'-O-)-methyltransferase